MLEISNLSFSYGRRKPLLFQDFSFGLQPGVVYGMLGKNGSGKSTLLYLMSGLLRPKSGTVQLNGVDVALRRPSTLQEICIVPEEFDLPRVSLRQYVALNAPFYPRFRTKYFVVASMISTWTTVCVLRNCRWGRKRKHS